jgi:hypothetical protein
MVTVVTEGRFILCVVVEVDECVQTPNFLDGLCWCKGVVGAVWLCLCVCVCVCVWKLPPSSTQMAGQRCIVWFGTLSVGGFIHSLNLHS